MQVFSKKSRKLRGVVVSVASLFLLVAFVCCSGLDRDTTGASISGDYDGLSWVDVLPRDTSFVTGQVVIYNDGPEEIEIVAVRPQILSEDLSFHKAYIAGADRKYGNTDRTFGIEPSTEHWGQFSDAQGYKLGKTPRDEMQTEIMMSFTYTGDEPARMDSVNIDYLINGRQKTLSIDTAFTICATEAQCETLY